MGYIALALCYFLGSIPFGLIFGKILKGIDIRDYGSGNIGATNVMRTLGVGPAIMVFFLDTLKGLGAVLICEKVFHLGTYWIVFGGLLGVVGHNCSIFLRFRGGKGVATSLGLIIGLSPVIAGIAFSIWALLVGTTRYVSVSSIIATLSVPLQMIFWKSMHVPVPYQILASVAALVIILKHGSNIRRLLNGTEPKIGQKVSISEGGNKE